MVVGAAPDWFRETWTLVNATRPDRVDVFEKRLEKPNPSIQEVIDFLTAAMHEIHRSGVVERYLAAKRGGS
jgi:hypothetical protein